MQKNHQEKLASIRLIRSENIGPRTYHSLVKKFGSAQKAIESFLDARKQVCSLESANQEIEQAEKHGIRILLHNDAAYPELLSLTYDPPPVLFYKGNLELLTKKAVAIVGTRNASANGCAITRKIVTGLGQAGLVIVSGLARGIDAEAHKASLATGTIAIVAGGLDSVYPPENEKLFHKIAEQGLIISENPVGVKPVARHFPQRNRIVAGISSGVLVVEAARKSGSLITAEFGLKEGREVFAVPGSPLDPRCSGTNYLLKNGAVLVEDADDITNNLQGIRQPDLFLDDADESESGVADIKIDDSGIREQVISKLGSSPISIDEIVQQINAPVAAINEVLLELEMAGKLQRQFGNKVSLAA